MGRATKLWLLFLIGITATAVIAVAANSQQQYFEEDDDFGDFDNEGDMIEEVDSVPEPEDEDEFDDGSDATQGKEAAASVPVQKLVMAPVEEDDEAIVESEDADEFSHLTDEEEFIGYTGEGVGGSPRSHQARKEATKEPKITIANVPLHLRSNWDSFYLELLLLAGLLIYFTNFSFGRTKNARLATAWFDSHKSFLVQQFALVGDDCKAVADNNNSSGNGSSGTEKSVVTSSGGCAGLQKESENVYSLYCSGRSCVHSMMVELRFIKRQDLVSVLAQVLRPSTDEVVIRLQLDEMDSFVLCMAAKKMAAKYVKEMTDIITYCPGDRKTPLPSKQYGSGSTSSKFVVWSELAEAVTAVLGDQRTVAVLSKHLARINYLHISDQYSGPRQPDQDQQQTLANAVKMPEVHKVIIMSFQLLAGDPSKGGNSNTTVAGTPKDMEALRPLVMLALHLADKLSRLRLSKESNAKAERNRSRVEEAFLKATHAVRAERAQEKREEKKRTEREKIMEIDDPEKQRKWEEKENRRAAKRKGPKMKQLKVA